MALSGSERVEALPQYLVDLFRTAFTNVLSELQVLLGETLSEARRVEMTLKVTIDSSYPRGILLSGSRGSGKTASWNVFKTCARRSNAWCTI